MAFRPPNREPRLAALGGRLGLRFGEPGSVEDASQLSRRALLSALSALGILCFEGNAEAEAPSAPVPVQAQVIARILPFERGFAQVSANTVGVIIAERSGDADSASAARQMARALEDIGSIAKKPIVSASVTFVSASALVNECKKRSALVLYLTPGLGNEMAAIGAGLAGSRVLTVAAVESDVPRGAVLGIEVVAGKPHMSINLAQAKIQKLDFPSAVLKLARIY
ncbi:MAG: YfiR/HmsC family protein [Polyangiaceae bacterium]